MDGNGRIFVVDDLHNDNGFCEDDVEDPTDPQPYLKSADHTQTNHHVKIVELLPEDKFHTNRSIIDLASLDPVAYTATEQGLVPLDETVPVAEDLIQQPLAAIGDIVAIPPAVLQKVLAVEDGERDLHQRDDIVAPIIHGCVTPRLSVSDDGFIKLKNYKVSFDVIGGGTLSEVRAAINVIDGKKYAVKIFSKTKLKKVSMLRRNSRNPVEDAYREAALLRRLDHENVIKLYDFIDDPEDQNIYIVLEFMDRVLMDIPSTFYYQEEEARRYFMHIKEGIKHLHSCGIVHRDLKPQNLLVSSSDIVKIADFNFCDELVLQDDGTEAVLLTAAQGTPAFTAPECLLPDERYCAGRPLDLWGLGATLYVLVTGELPFRALLLPELFESILNDPVEFPEKIALSGEIKSVILHLMEKDPKKRLIMSDLELLPWLRFV
ncbi:calcium/calmodulin-dependent protein kinase kinase 1-like [Paramacrobiotus metropolitanus]|uniref:calcium/calmodulin-dependent protein kinase kinase 1-like n=1 Tax=Paramacrobiotus metropolitanus TaxID=2943436 RepID=UPI00244602F5|nr:calcium/calmodulin-dependent protein kinase kinase 1-like [Paramacrobiotus metropolitanus]